MDQIERKPGRPGRPAARGRKASVEGMESRLLMAADPAPNVILHSISTADSQSLTVNYDVRDSDLGQSLEIDVFRSPDSTIRDGTQLLGSLVIAKGSLDSAGKPATEVGTHRVTLPLPGGLPPTPKLPYVVAVADPLGRQGESSVADNSASFRKRVVAVITHGGMQPKNWAQAGPPWTLRMESWLQREGYDGVIAYNWAGASRKAGNAARQAKKLAARIGAAVGRFQSTDPVDLHLIGHSEGAIVNSLALNRVEGEMPATLKSGFIEMTMLDPHAANNHMPGAQYSVSKGLLGWIARETIDQFQSKAKDPAPFVPSSVDRADVFFQRTPVGQTYTSNSGIYNLWGQVPVRGVANYYNLTAPGISHAGRFGVQDWYQVNVVPTLGEGGRRVEDSTLSITSLPELHSVLKAGSKATYAGLSAPGSTVLLRSKPLGSDGTSRVVGRTIAGPSGTWSVTTKRLPSGRFRYSAMASLDSPRNHARRDPMKPMVWMPPVTVARNSG